MGRAAARIATGRQAFCCPRQYRERGFREVLDYWHTESCPNDWPANRVLVCRQRGRDRRGPCRSWGSVASADHSPGSALPSESRKAGCTRDSREAAGTLCASRICTGRRPDELWLELHRGASPGRCLCRPHPQRREARRPARPARHKIRFCHQPENRQGDQHRDSCKATGARRRGDRMTRREFITLLGGAAAAWPLAANAQQPAKLPTIGYLGASTPSFDSHRVGAFVQRLRELGWIEGRTVAIEYRWAEGRRERFAEIAAEFVQLKVDVIVTVGAAALAAKQVTPTIPIVFATATDPLGGGLVASLARPEGNATGLSMQASDAAGKRLELLREVVPGLRRLAVIGDVEYTATVQEIAEVRAAARTLGLDLDVLEIRRAEDIAGAYPALKAGSQALYVCASPLVNANHARINTLALGARLPTMHAVRDFLGAAGLMSYGPSIVHSFRRAADYVDKILRGAKPVDLPVEQPTKFDLVFNLTTAKALDLEIPAMLLARADEVIE